MKCRGKVNKAESLAGKSLEEIVNIKPVNEATKKDLRLVNDLIRFGFRTVEEVVNEAIASENPTLISLVSQFVNGVNIEQKGRLTEAIKVADEKVLISSKSITQKPKTNDVIEEARLTGKSVKWVAERRKVDAVIEKYANMKLEEIVRFNPVFMHASKNDVRAVNFLIHRGIKTVDDVANEAIMSNNAKLMYYILMFVDGITDYHKFMLIQAINRTHDFVIIHNTAYKFPDAAKTLSRGIVNSGFVNEMVTYARDIDNAPLDYLGNNILDKVTKETAGSIFYFVRDNHESLSQEFIIRATNKAFELQVPWVIANMAQFGGASIDKLISEIVNAVGKVKENAPYLLKFIIDCHEAPNFPLENMVKVLIETNNHRCVYRLIREDFIKDDELLRKLVNKLVSKARTNCKHYCNNLLVSLVLDDKYYSYCALEGIIRLNDPILLNYIIGNTKNEQFIIRSKEALDYLNEIQNRTLGNDEVSDNQNPSTTSSTRVRRNSKLVLES